MRHGQSVLSIWPAWRGRLGGMYVWSLWVVKRRSSTKICTRTKLGISGYYRAVANLLMWVSPLFNPHHCHCWSHFLIMPPKASTAAQSSQIVPAGRREVFSKTNPARQHGKRDEQGQRPTTSKALVLRNGKYGSQGTGELVYMGKMSGREKLDLLAGICLSWYCLLSVYIELCRMKSGRKSYRGIQESDSKPFTNGEVCKDGWISDWWYVDVLISNTIISLSLAFSVYRWYRNSERPR